MRELTNPDPPCHMEERHRLVVEGLLRDAREARRLLPEQEDGEEGWEDDGKDSDLEEADEGQGQGKGWSRVEKQLWGSGFSAEHTQQVRSALLPATAPLSLSDCLDWLCLHLPESGMSVYMCARLSNESACVSNKETIE